VPHSGQIRDTILTITEHLSTTTISLDFSSRVTWDLGFLVDDVTGWLNNSTDSETSKVGTLSSPQFLKLVQPFVEEDTLRQFHRMIYAISLAYAQPNSSNEHQFTTPELLQIGSIAGHNFLAGLDKLLKPQQLRSCSRSQFQSLYLMIFGTILAVGYTNLLVLETTPQRLAQFQNTRDFLCQILVHYLLFLGSQLRLSIARKTEEFILQASPSRWHKQGLFQWTIAPKVESSSCAGTEQTLDLDDMSEFNWLASSGMITYDLDPSISAPSRPTTPTNRRSEDSPVLIALDEWYGVRLVGHGYRARHARPEFRWQTFNNSGSMYATRIANDESEALFRYSFRSVNILQPM
jgi:hypothetical protein